MSMKVRRDKRTFSAFSPATSSISVSVQSVCMSVSKLSTCTPFCFEAHQNRLIRFYVWQHRIFKSLCSCMRTCRLYGMLVWWWMLRWNLSHITWLVLCHVLAGRTIAVLLVSDLFTHLWHTDVVWRDHWELNIADKQDFRNCWCGGTKTASALCCKSLFSPCQQLQ